jgi:hypothetical protein
VRQRSGRRIFAVMASALVKLMYLYAYSHLLPNPPPHPWTNGSQLESSCMPYFNCLAQFPMRYASLVFLSLVATRFLEVIRAVPCSYMYSCVPLVSWPPHYPPSVLLLSLSALNMCQVPLILRAGYAKFSDYHRGCHVVIMRDRKRSVPTV